MLDLNFQPWRRALLCWGGCLLLLSGCGAAGPLGHPAHTLKTGEVSGAVGFSTKIVSSAVKNQIADGQSASGTDADEAESAFFQGVLLEHVLAPGPASWVNARVGLEGNREAGLSFYGRTVRIDGRQGFSNEHWALSFGLGLSALMRNLVTQDADETSNVGRFAGTEYTSENGSFGIDLPILLGWRGGPLPAWLGPRAGMRRLRGTIAQMQNTFAELEATQLFLSSHTGASVRLGGISLLVETVVSRHWFDATVDFEGGTAPVSRSAEMTGWSIEPMLGLTGHF